MTSSIFGKRYRFFEDPGHGWLEVPYCDLDRAGVAALISEYSYQSLDGWLVYLEEDCDLATFARAEGWKEGDWSKHIGPTVHHADDRIRRLPHYRYQRPEPVREWPKFGHDWR